MSGLKQESQSFRTEKFKVIIAGSRNISNYQALYEFLNFFNHSTVIDKNFINVTFLSGCCPTGPDQVPYLLQKMQQYRNIIIQEYPADWTKHGRAAGPIRNREMAKEADCLVLIWDGKSPGSANMKKEMEKLNKSIWEIIVNT